GRRVECRRAEEREGPCLHVVAQRCAQSGTRGLLVHLDREVARARREHDAAARELRGADRARAGAARALLTPRLRAAAGDEPAALRRARALTARVHLRADDLVHEMRLHLGAEDRRLERDLLRGLAAEQRCLRRGHYFDISLISTMPFFGPGTAPLTSKRFRSAPIESGLRMLCEPCVTGPRLNRCRLIVPWKPLPIDVPATLIASPGWKISTVTFSPCTASAKWPRNSTRWRYAPLTPFFARWPRSGREILRSATGSHASCTAS